MKLYFVRHGQTHSNVARLMYGHKESPLTEKGIDDAKATAKNLPNDFDLIYSSDIGRAKHTTEILNEKLNLPIIYDARLRERNFGSLEGKDLLSTNPNAWQKDHIQEYDYRPYGGESVEDVKKRVMDFVNEITKKHNSKKVLIVTHGGVMRLLHLLVKGYLAEKIPNSSLHEFDFPDN
jgi:broad specificity phosphatase PhoE